VLQLSYLFINIYFRLRQILKTVNSLNPFKLKFQFFVFELFIKLFKLNSIFLKSGQKFLIKYFSLLKCRFLSISLYTFNFFSMRSTNYFFLFFLRIFFRCLFLCIFFTTFSLFFLLPLPTRIISNFSISQFKRLYF
jgi:hypothetical protein